MKRTKSDFASVYPNVEKERDRVYISLMKLRKAKETEVHTVTDGNTKEEEIDSTVSGLVTEFSIWEKEVKGVKEKMLKLFDEKPTPSSYEVEDMKNLLEDLRTAGKTAKPLYIKLAVEISKYGDEQKKKTKTEEMENSMKKLQEEISLFVKKGQEYQSKFTPTVPAPVIQPQAAVHSKNIPLERLPLPTFKGNKTDYLRFKKEFEQHVKYESQEERMLALKTKCLLKAVDKKRVANELTL